ncbi:MAG TPA: flagellar hook capping FlgD N-terminal domain-containing protein, partial [Steroidobacteraceae bacterium]|nr:flagellar hook capping FlgD N-terminal domain-containing protein [Steroidobacteraceae bacterium]
MITTEVGNEYSALGLAATPKADASKELGAEDFLKLMLTQFQNQDPLKPLDNGDFIGQLAQFGTVTGLTQLRQDFGSLADSLVSNQALQASSLLGRDVLVNQSV